jgi:hypothetical protein
VTWGGSISIKQKSKQPYLKNKISAQCKNKEKNLLVSQVISLRFIGTVNEKSKETH